MDRRELSTTTTAIDGLLVISAHEAGDERGIVREVFRASALEQAGVAFGGVRQVNATESRRGALRGIHAEAMTKLVAVVAGEAFGAYVDLRRGSTSFGAVVSVPLVPGVQVLVPEGVGNGFQALVDGTQYVYCFDREWHAGMAGTACHPLDPELAIEWPLPVDVHDRAQISAKDASAPRLSELGSSRRG